VKGWSDRLLGALPYVYVLVGLYVLAAPAVAPGRAAGLLFLLLAVSLSLFKLRLDHCCKVQTLADIATRRGAR
jgi:hypothetical protein